MAAVRLHCRQRSLLLLFPSACVAKGPWENAPAYINASITSSFAAGGLGTPQTATGERRHVVRSSSHAFVLCPPKESSIPCFLQSITSDWPSSLFHPLPFRVFHVILLIPHFSFRFLFLWLPYAVNELFFFLPVALLLFCDSPVFSK